MSEARERDSEATKARLLQAVEGLISEEGFGALGINAMARRAGVDKVLIYRYFGGLPGLLAAYAEHGDFWWQVDDILRDPRPAKDAPDALARTLRLVVERHIAFLRSHPVTLETIAWELAQRNELTQALESVRESRSRAMMARVATELALDEEALVARIGPMLALLGAATNYLAARGRRLRIFNGIDLQCDAGWSTLTNAAAAMIDCALIVQPIEEGDRS